MGQFVVVSKSRLSAPLVPLKPAEHLVLWCDCGGVSLMTSVHFYAHHSFQCDFCFALIDSQCEDQRNKAFRH